MLLNPAVLCVPLNWGTILLLCNYRSLPLFFAFAPVFFVFSSCHEKLMSHGTRAIFREHSSYR